MVKQEIKSFRMDCGEHKGLECIAPCSLYSVLYGNNLIGDPSVSDNVARIATYSERGCTFYAEFEVTPLVMSMKNVLIRFHGLDTLCHIEINGHKIGMTDNMHRTYDFDVKTKLNIGNNVLKLTFMPVKKGSDLRKALFSFGTEHTPYLPDMGIFRKIEILAFNHKIISDVRVKQTHSEGAVRLDLSVRTVGYDDLSRAVATLTSPAGNVYFCGFIGGEGSITVTDPNLWWPNGLGMQNLYKLNVNLYSDSEIEDTYEMRIGLRTVSLDRGENGNLSLSVNGCPVFAMGGEYMSEDIILSRLSPERTTSLLLSASQANFNSVFVHGSGYYPENCFFDACDELGLIAWMEIPLPERDGVDTTDVAEGLKRELSDNLTRMAHHPSLAVIVGNERVRGLFASESEAQSFAGSFSDFEGMNVFDIGGECRECFAKIGYPSLPTYDSAVKLAEPKNRNLCSDVFEQHGAKGDTVIKMLADAYENYPYANGMSELSYIMGLSSAERSMADAESIRREKVRPLGILMKTMNDSWPSISASAVDYYGGKKPLHYYEKSFFAPVRVTAVRNGTRVRFVVSNDMRQDYTGIFAYAIMNNKNQPVFRDSFPIRARASSNLDVYGADIGSAISGHENEYYLMYSVSDKSNESSVGIHLFTKIKKFNFLKPNYSIDIVGNGTDYVATIGADCFVKGVEISFGKEIVTADRNYFDILGKAPVRIRLTTPRITSIEKLKRVMTVRSVYDLGHED